MSHPQNSFSTKLAWRTLARYYSQPQDSKETRIAGSPPWLLWFLHIALLVLPVSVYYVSPGCRAKSFVCFQSVWAAIKIPQPWGPQEFVFHGSGGWESKSKMSAWLGSGRALFLAWRWPPLCCVLTKWKVRMLMSSSYKDTSPRPHFQHHPMVGLGFHHEF